MKIVKKLLGIFFALSLIFSMFTGTGLRAFADSTQLSEPTGLFWNSDNNHVQATWDSVDNASSYTVQLYCGGIAVGGPVSSITDATYDFTSILAANSYGEYTFTVQAIGDVVNYSNSDALATSGEYDYIAPTLSTVYTQTDGTPSGTGTTVDPYTWSITPSSLESTLTQSDIAVPANETATFYTDSSFFTSEDTVALDANPTTAYIKVTSVESDAYYAVTINQPTLISTVYAQTDGIPSGTGTNVDPYTWSITPESVESTLTQSDIAVPANETATFYTDYSFFTSEDTVTLDANPTTAYIEVTSGESTAFYAVTIYQPELVTFDPQNGDDTFNATTSANLIAKTPTDPTFSEHTFLGWFTAPTGGSEVYFPVTVTNNTTTFYAQWLSTPPVDQSGLIADIYSSEQTTGGVTPSTDGYQKYTYTFTASDSSTPISFLFRNDPDYFAFDDVSITDNADSNATNLLTNGSFETTYSSNDSIFPSSWSLIGTQGLDAAGEIDSGGANSGTYYWSDGAVGGFDGLQQTIATTAGHTYTMTFCMGSGEWDNIQAPTTADVASYRNAPDTTEMLVYAGSVPSGFTITPPSETSFTATFNPENGIDAFPGTVDTQGVVTASSDPTFSGYTFNGWYTAPVGGTNVTFPATITSSTNYYGQWTENEPVSVGGAVTTPVDIQISAPSAPDSTGTTGAQINFGQTNTSTVNNVTVDLSTVVVTAPAAVLNAALGNDPSAYLKLTQAPASVDTTAAVDTAASSSGITPVSTLDVDLTKYYADGTSEAIHALSGNISVKINLTDAQVAQITNPTDAKLFYYDPTAKSLINMNGIFDLTAKTVTFTTNHFSTFVISTDPAITYTPGVSYLSHIQSLGWTKSVTDGVQSGTTGKKLRLEAVRLSLTGAPSTAHITYQVHVQGMGWASVASDGAIAGTTGKHLRAEAIRITISGLDGYELQYRVHGQTYGWSQGWKTVQNGTDISKAAIAGTTGKSLRLEAIEVRLVKVS